MGTFFSSPRIPRVVRIAPKDAFVVKCDALPEAVVNSAEKAALYASFFAKQVLALDESPCTSVLMCSESCMRSMAVLITFCLLKGLFDTADKAQYAIRRRQKHLADVNALPHYRSAIEIALILLHDHLEV